MILMVVFMKNCYDCISFETSMFVLFFSCISYFQLIKYIANDGLDFFNVEA